MKLEYAVIKKAPFKLRQMVHGDTCVLEDMDLTQCPQNCGHSHLDVYTAVLWEASELIDYYSEGCVPQVIEDMHNIKSMDYSDMDLWDSYDLESAFATFDVDEIMYMGNESFVDMVSIEHQIRTLRKVLKYHDSEGHKLLFDVRERMEEVNWKVKMWLNDVLPKYKAKYEARVAQLESEKGDNNGK